MDEFQDTNPRQARLVELVRSADRFYAVGAMNQSILGFRHAEPAGFERFRDEVEAAGGKLVRLEDNFRSRPQILRAVEKITAGAAGIDRAAWWRGASSRRRAIWRWKRFARRRKTRRGARNRSALGGAARGRVTG